MGQYLEGLHDLRETHSVTAFRVVGMEPLGEVPEYPLDRVLVGTGRELQHLVMVNRVRVGHGSGSGCRRIRSVANPEPDYFLVARNATIACSSSEVRLAAYAGMFGPPFVMRSPISCAVIRFATLLRSGPRSPPCPLI